MIEDTTFLVDVLNGDDRAIERLAFVEGERRAEKVAAVSVLELHEAVRRSGRPAEEREAVLDVLDSKQVVPADGSVMRRTGEISGTLYERGEPIDREDCIVAATALREGEPVVTRNADHFERVDGIEVRSY